MTKQTALSIIAIFWLLSIICGGVAGFFLYPHVYPCNSNVGSVVVSVTDSIAPAKDTLPISINVKPKKVSVKKYNVDGPHCDQISDKIYTTFNDSNGFNSDQYRATYSLCLDTNIYHQDTFLVDNFRAQTTAIITGNELIALNVSYQNLKPEKWKVLSKTVTVEKKQSLVKVYTGIYAGVSIANKTVASYHGGVGLDAIISDRHLIGFQGGLNSSLQPEFGVRFSEKIRLKK